MSDRFAGPPDPPGQPTDRGEFRSQQGVRLGYVAVIEQIMDVLATRYAPEYESSGDRLVTTWQRGGVPDAPLLNHQTPEAQPNWFVGEQYVSANQAPQSIVFWRSNGSVDIRPNLMIGHHATGYRQIANALQPITARVLGFDDDDTWAMVNALLSSVYETTAGSTGGEFCQGLQWLPKTEGNRGTAIDARLLVGVPVWDPPLAPQIPERFFTRGEIWPNGISRN